MVCIFQWIYCTVEKFVRAVSTPRDNTADERYIEERLPFNIFPTVFAINGDLGLHRRLLTNVYKRKIR